MREAERSGGRRGRTSGFERAGESMRGPSRDLAAPVGARLRLAAAWAAAAGALTARRCPVEGLSGGELNIRVPDARWQREVQRHAEELVRGLRAHGVAADGLRVRLDPSLAAEGGGMRPGVERVARPVGVDATRLAGGGLRSGATLAAAPDNTPASPAGRLDRLRADYLAAADRARINAPARAGRSAFAPRPRDATPSKP